MPGDPVALRLPRTLHGIFAVQAILASICSLQANGQIASQTSIFRHNVLSN